MLYTGNYTNCKGNMCVSISGDRGKKANFSGLAYPTLAPRLNFWQIWYDNIGKIPEEENTRYYIHEYYEQVLKKLDPYKVFDELDNSILLCYENEKEFCHRHLVAFWLEENLNIKVNEVKVTKTCGLINLDRPEYLRYMLLNELCLN